MELGFGAKLTIPTGQWKLVYKKHNFKMLFDESVDIIINIIEKKGRIPAIIEVGMYCKV